MLWEDYRVNRHSSNPPLYVQIFCELNKYLNKAARYVYTFGFVLSSWGL